MFSKPFRATWGRGGLERLRQPYGAGTMVGALFVLLASVYLVFDWLPGQYVLHEGLSEEAWLKARNDIRTTGVQVLAGVIVLMGALFTARTFNLNKEGQLTDRYLKAVECLGSEQMHVRVGAIYALERLARDSTRDHTTIMEVLCNYVRGGRRKPGVREYPADLQAALKVIGRRAARQDSPQFRIDLGGADLTGAVLARANLENASFVRSRLCGAVLAESRLNGARFVEAKMEGVSLIGARLRNAKFGGADLQRSALYEADFANADLRGSRLSDTEFSKNGRGISHAYIMSAIAKTVGVIPSRFGAGPPGDASLQGVRLDNATYSSSTRWPQNFDVKSSGASQIG